MSLDYRLRPVRTAAILTTSYVTGTVLDQEHFNNQLVLLVNFTLGSLTTAEIRVEGSPDNTNFYQETFQSIATGTATETRGEHQISTTGLYRILIPIKDRYIRVSAKGTGTVTGSSMTIDAVTGEV